MSEVLARPPRVGLIGAGTIAPLHLQGWLALGAEVVVFSRAGAADLVRSHGGTVVDTLEALWPQVDLVDIVTPTGTHPEYALAAIAQGKHVVCEKPLARTAGVAAEMVRAAAAAGVHLFPAHVVRYFPAYAAARAAIEDGTIGKVAISRFRRMSAAPAAPWFFDEAASGGIIMDQMIHDLDQARWFAGPVVSVYARSTTRRAGTDDVGAPGGTDTVTNTAGATVILTHASGAISYCDGVWGHPGLPFTYSFEIAGDQGTIGYDHARDDTARLSLGDGSGAAGGYLPATNPVESPYTAELADFLAAITGTTTAAVTGADGVQAIVLAEAALASLASGEPVLVDERSQR